MGTCCITQGALLSILRVPDPDGNLGKEEMHVYV